MEAPASSRNDAIDWLRGAVMILMALDHARMFVGSGVDLHTAPPALYFTRWVTHFCAPVFVLLAGTAAYLHGRRLASTRALAGYLAKRGIWLVVLEVTLVRFAWIFDLAPSTVILQVIWAIGISMLVLAGLVWLPRAALVAVAGIIIGGHNLFDGWRAEQLDGLRWLWILLHEQGELRPFGGAMWFVVYPVIPWVAVMTAGYALGPWALLPRDERRARFARAGVALIVGFVALRATNLYGDPHPWTAEGGVLRAALSFLNCEKYPPSLLFLAMTIGPALCVLAWMDRPLGPWASRVAVYGRVPLFFYVLHLFVIHAVAIGIAWPALGAAAVAYPFVARQLAYPLPAVYALWLGVVLALYPACRWFAEVKRQSRAAWMSYL